jgi:hypothetical protein
MGAYFACFDLDAGKLTFPLAGVLRAWRQQLILQGKTINDFEHESGVGLWTVGVW